MMLSFPEYAVNDTLNNWKSLQQVSWHTLPDLLLPDQRSNAQREQKSSFRAPVLRFYFHRIPEAMESRYVFSYTGLSRNGSETRARYKKSQPRAFPMAGVVISSDTFMDFMSHKVITLNGKRDPTSAFTRCSAG